MSKEVMISRTNYQCWWKILPWVEKRRPSFLLFFCLLFNSTLYPTYVIYQATEFYISFFFPGIYFPVKLCKKQQLMICAKRSVVCGWRTHQNPWHGFRVYFFLMQNQVFLLSVVVLLLFVLQHLLSEYIDRKWPVITELLWDVVTHTELPPTELRPSWLLVSYQWIVGVHFSFVLLIYMVSMIMINSRWSSRCSIHRQAPQGCQVRWLWCHVVWCKFFLFGYFIVVILFFLLETNFYFVPAIFKIIDQAHVQHWVPKR